MAAGLHDKNIRAANVFQDLKSRLAIAELPALSSPARHAQIVADRFAELWIRASAENLELVVRQRSPLKRRPAGAEPCDTLPAKGF
jgi:hypothetical protein